MPKSKWLKTVAAVCGLVCWPPLPSYITAKLTFLPPSPPSYHFESLDGDDDEGNNDGSPQRTDFIINTGHECVVIRDRVKRFSVVTKDKNRLACCYFPVPNADLIVLYSHGNAADIGHTAAYLLELSLDLNCDIVAYDYSGYGHSTGRPFESVIYHDIEAVYRYLVEEMRVDPKSIILYGQSIGSTAVIDLAGKYEVGAVILHSPLMSGLRVLRNMSRTWFFDPFKNIVKIKKVPAVVMVVHGTQDDLIPFEQGEAIHNAAPHAAPPLWIEGGGHNDLETFPELRQRLKEFVAQFALDRARSLIVGTSADNDEGLDDIGQAT